MRSSTSNLPEARYRSALNNEFARKRQDGSLIPHANTTAIVEVLTNLLFHFIEQKRVVAYFTQLHDGVHQGLGIACFAILSCETTRERVVVLWPDPYRIVGEEHSS